MEPTIHILSSDTINQIAAGEVIESPASVVKELMENALDAQATKISIEIAGGGIKLIKVSDDGIGMHSVDAKNSIVRHATSKILKAHDLFHISTKGFRGEALASIASISKMCVQTAREGENGTKLLIEKGSILKSTPCARTRGTTIEVSSLFYTVPARKKFQKSASAIAAEIFRIVTVMSLSHPEVGFELITNGRRAIQTQPLSGDFQEIMKKRAEELLGQEFTSGSFPLYFKEESLEFFGLLGAPMNTRTNKVNCHLFVNQRAVVCKPINEALREGYGTRLDPRRHPIFLLYLNVPPDLVDINVHPQKLEVRLRKEELFREKVIKAVQQALSSKNVQVSCRASDFSFTPFQFEEMSICRYEQKIAEVPLDFAIEAEWIGQFDSYLFFREKDEMIVVDSKAAQFRILFERLLSNMEKGGEKQGLLVPFSIDLMPIEAAMVLTHMEAIEKLGFSLRPIGKEVFLVEALPPFLEEGEVKALLVDVGLAMQEFIGKIDYDEKRRDLLALISAQKGQKKRSFSSEEGKYLLRELRKCESPFHSPKGDKAMIVVNHERLESLFRSDCSPAKADR